MTSFAKCGNDWCDIPGPRPSDEGYETCLRAGDRDTWGGGGVLFGDAIASLSGEI